MFSRVSVTICAMILCWSSGVLYGTIEDFLSVTTTTKIDPPQASTISSRKKSYQSIEDGYLSFFHLDVSSDLNRLVRGGGSPTQSANNEAVAVCNFGEWAWTSHQFPHTMERIYRCFSYFRANPNKNWHLVFNSSTNFHQAQKSYEYNRGMFQALQDAFQVTIHTQQPTPIDLNAIAVEAYRPKGDNQAIYHFASPNDAAALRDGIVNHYKLNTTNSCSSQQPRIGILNRQSTRKWLNDFETKNATEQKLGMLLPPISVAYFEGESFLEQVQFFRDTDILISPHGAGLTGMVFMPDCGRIIELNGNGYYWPTYFGSLAISASLNFSSIYTASAQNRTAEVDYWMSTLERRFIARNRPITTRLDYMLEAMEIHIEGWRECCQANKELV